MLSSRASQTPDPGIVWLSSSCWVQHLDIICVSTACPLFSCPCWWCCEHLTGCISNAAWGIVLHFQVFVAWVICCLSFIRTSLSHPQTPHRIWQRQDAHWYGNHSTPTHTTPRGGRGWSHSPLWNHHGGYWCGCDGETQHHQSLWIAFVWTSVRCECLITRDRANVSGLALHLLYNIIATNVWIIRGTSVGSHSS